MKKIIIFFYVFLFSLTSCVPYTETDESELNFSDSSSQFSITSVYPEGPLEGLLDQINIKIKTNMNSNCIMTNVSAINYGVINEMNRSGLEHNAMVVIEPNTNYRFMIDCVNLNSKVSRYFEFSTIGAIDNIAPSITIQSPIGTLPASTRVTNAVVSTNEKSMCRFSTNQNFVFENGNTVATEDGLTHVAKINVLPSRRYKYYFLCSDESNNTSLFPSQLEFQVASEGDIDKTAPLLSNLRPLNDLAIGTTSTTLSFSTNENALCRWSLRDDIDYSQMQLMANSGQTQHSQVLSSLIAEKQYSYTVQCRDLANNSSLKHEVKFKILVPLMDGEKLYANNCMNCHNTLENSTKKNKAAFAIESAIDGVPSMNTTQLRALSSEQVFQIAKVLSLAPPKLFALKPSGNLAFVKKVKLEFVTDEKAICRYDSSDKSLSSMSGNFNQTVLSSSHSKEIAVNGDTSYKYYVRCQDEYSFESNTSDVISFKIEKELVQELIPPVIQIVAPLGNFESGTSAVVLNVNSNEAASCRYTKNKTTEYEQMSVMMTTGNQVHKQEVGGLSDGGNYSYYIICADPQGNKSIKSTINFKILEPRVFDGEQLYSVNCASCHYPLEQSDQKFRSSREIEDAIASVGFMNKPEIKSLNKQQIDAISAVLSDFEQEQISTDRLETHIQLADRRFVYKVVAEAFGAGDIEIRARQRDDYLVYWNNNAFSGACDPYATAGTEFEFEACPKNQAKIYANKGALYSNMRGAYSTRICESYAGNNSSGKGFNYLMSELGGLDTDWSTAKFNIIYEKFYRLETPAIEVTRKFKELFESQETKEMGWKGVVLGVCISPGWQIL